MTFEKFSRSLKVFPVSARWESPRISDIPSYFMLDLVNGGWESEPMDDAKLPGDFVIDYVRAWQRKDLASALDGPKPNQGTPAAPTQ
jgi:beta-glucanase (GH16 family)